jgi:uncharacterized heparinase superfamily protein
MTLARWATLARKAMHRPPRYVLARLAHEARLQARRPWSRIRPRMLSDDRLLRETGHHTIDELWDALARRPFFLQPPDQAAWRRQFVEGYPHETAAIVARADAVLRHEFDLLGSGPCALGDRIPWHEDFKSRRVWPLQYSHDIDTYDLSRPSDIKIPWELSRCQHFAVLGQAYWLTGDERYAREFAAEVEDWIDSNPWLHGVNWVCAMDVAMRAISWIWGVGFFAGAEACRSPRFRSAMLRSLYLHGEFVSGNIERADVNGNHYLTDGVGLVFVGTFFARTAQGSSWLRTGRAIVVDEILNQTTPDGVDFEQSVPYHRLVLEGLLTSYLLLRLNGETIPAECWQRLERMIEYVAAYTKPDGQAPLHGDADDGRMQQLGTQEINDHRYLVSAGAVIFDRPDFKRAAERFRDDAFWLCGGPAGAAKFKALSGDAEPPSSVAFRDGGIYVMRDRRTHVFIDCAPVGLAGMGGHGHNDILGFELFLDGSNLVTDCGAYVYTASAEWRDRFRSTAFHNTVQVDDEELNRFLDGDMWRLRYDAVPARVSWSETPDEVRLAGGHEGYRRLASPVSHDREFVLRKGRDQLSIVDRLTGAGTRRLVSRFHLDPAVTPALAGDRVRLHAAGRDFWFLLVDAPEDTKVTIEPAWVSPRYGIKVPANCITISCTATLPVRLACRFAVNPS